MIAFAAVTCYRLVLCYRMCLYHTFIFSSHAIFYYILDMFFTSDFKNTSVERGDDVKVVEYHHAQN